MDRRIHVVHMVLSLEPGGLENGVVNVVNGLDPQRFRSTVCCLKARGAFAARIRAADATIVDGGLRDGRDLLAPLRLARTLRALRPCIVHTRNAEAFLYGSLAARLAGVPVLVHSEHGRSFDDGAGRRRAQRWLSPLATRIFSVSAQLRDDLVRHIGIPAPRIDVLYNGVDLARFADRDAAAARRLLGVTPDQLVVGSVGRLVPVKNYPLLLRALAGLADPRLVAVLVGDGPERAALAALAQQLGVAGQLRMLGHRDDVASLLPGFDVFVLPSFSEGLSNTLLEAMACGVAPVVSAVGGNTEIVRNGIDGRVFVSDDLTALTGALRDLAGQPALRQTLAQAGQARIREQFGIDAMIARYERYYAQAWAQGGN